MSGRVRAAALATAALVALAGCGGSDSGAAKKAATEFYAALRGGDGAKACSLLTPDEAQSASSAGAGGPGASCASTIGQIAAGLPAARVKSVKVSGSKATVILTAGSNLPITLDLQKQGDKWRVAHFS